MKLSELSLPTSEVEVPGAGTIIVRGLSFNDACELFRKHGEALQAIYSEQISPKDDLPNAETLIRTLLQKAPDALAAAIALANDDPTGEAAAKKLPFAVQIRAGMEIAALTFVSEAEVKNLLEAVIQAGGTVTSLLSSLGAPEA